LAASLLLATGGLLLAFAAADMSSLLHAWSSSVAACSTRQAETWRETAWVRVDNEPPQACAPACCRCGNTLMVTPCRLLTAKLSSRDFSRASRLAFGTRLPLLWPLTITAAQLAAAAAT
jgi:hypothetical protein